MPVLSRSGNGGRCAGYPGWRTIVCICLLTGHFTGSPTPFHGTYTVNFAFVYPCKQNLSVTSSLCSFVLVLARINTALYISDAPTSSFRFHYLLELYANHCRSTLLLDHHGHSIGHPIPTSSGRPFLSTRINYFMVYGYSVNQANPLSYRHLVSLLIALTPLPSTITHLHILSIHPSFRLPRTFTTLITKKRRDADN